MMSASYHRTATVCELRYAVAIRVCVLVAIANLSCASFALADPADNFVASIKDDAGLPQDVRDMIAKTWADCDDCDGEEFLTQALTMFSPQFRAGLDAYDDDQNEACARLMGELANHENPFIAVNAAAYQVKALAALEQMLEAGELITALRTPDDKKLQEFSYFAAEMAFLDGFCLLADLQYEKSVTAFEEFLKAYPESSQRLTLSARQMLAELGTRQDGRISEVVDLMTFSGRRLKNDDSGEKVRDRQDRIIKILDQLIEDAEKQEQSSNSSSSGGGGSGGGGTPSAPLQESSIPGGSTPGTGPLREGRRASPGDAWGAMPPAKRQEILQALKDSFPGRYRRLVEQYYTELAKKR